MSLKKIWQIDWRLMSNLGYDFLQKSKIELVMNHTHPFYLESPNLPNIAPS